MKYPEPTVGGIVLNQEGKLLLVRSVRSNNRYVIPGGHIKSGERMEEALKRELLEETGLQVDDIRLASVQEFIFHRAFYKKKHFIFLDFVCRASSSRVTLNWEHQEYSWVTLEEAFSFDLDPFTRRLLEEYRQGADSAYRLPVLYNLSRQHITG
jgi:nucleoside triphosphatase